MSPYLGVFFLVLMALKSAFSAPRIYKVEAGCLARFTREPAWLISLAPTVSPIMLVRLGAMAFIRLDKYSFRECLYSANSTTCVARLRMNISS